jgi:hypothetical protein
MSATATASTTALTAPALTTQTIPDTSTDIVTELRAAWQEYQTVEKRGLAFGQRLHELQAKTSAQGNHSGKGFLQHLQQAGIPQRTAYYWIHSYEISIGEREPRAPKVEKPVVTPVAPTLVTVEPNDEPAVILSPITSGYKQTVWEQFRPFHYMKDSFNKAARCFRATIDGQDIGFAAAITQPSGTLKNAYRAHKTVIMLPEDHPDYLRFWSAVSDAQAKYFVAQGCRYFAQTPKKYSGYRDLPESGWIPTTKNGRGRCEQNGNTSHEYVGVSEAVKEAVKEVKEHSPMPTNTARRIGAAAPVTPALPVTAPVAAPVDAPVVETPVTPAPDPVTQIIDLKQGMLVRWNGQVFEVDEIEDDGSIDDLGLVKNDPDIGKRMLTVSFLETCDPQELSRRYAAAAKAKTAKKTKKTVQSMSHLEKLIGTI